MKKILISILFVISIFFLTINTIPPKKITNDHNSKFISDRVLIAAHRGGKNLNPENTLKAIDEAIVLYKSDIIEMDLCLTKDQELILSHNLTLDAYCDVPSTPYVISEHNFNEIKKLNFGYHFKDKTGAYPYRNLLDGISNDQKEIILEENKLGVVRIEDLFKLYPNELYIIEIKDQGSLGLKATDILCKLIEKYQLEENVIVGTFHDEVTSHLQTNYPNILRGGSVGEVTDFVITHLLGVNLFDNSDFSALQIPTSRKAFNINFNLDKRSIVARAKRRGMSVQYWTINDVDEMRKIIDLGADVIMTDNPDVLYQLLVELELIKGDE